MKKLGTLLSLCAISWTSAFASQLTLTTSNVIGGSVTYGGTWDAGQFNAKSILDNQGFVVAEPSQSNYWLNPDNGPANAYITIDLGALYVLTSIQLFNTHNAAYSDRGTGDFSIVAGNSVVDNGATGFSLSGATSMIVSGTLAPASSDPIAGQSFAVTDPTAYRYLVFLPTSVSVGGGSCCGSNNYGLNELRAFGDVGGSVAQAPEPSTVVLLGFGVAGILWRRRSVAR